MGLGSKVKGLRNRKANKAHGTHEDEAEDAPALGEDRSLGGNEEAIAMQKLKYAANKVYAWRGDGFGYEPKMIATKYTSFCGGCISMMIAFLFLLNIAISLYVFSLGTTEIREEFKDVGTETDNVDIWERLTLSFADSSGTNYYAGTDFQFLANHVTSDGTNSLTLSSGSTCGIYDERTEKTFYSATTSRCLTENDATLRGVPDRGSSVYRYVQLQVQTVTGTAGATTFSSGTLSVGVKQKSPESMIETPGLFESYFEKLFSPAFFTGRMIEPVRLTPPNIIEGFDVRIPDGQQCWLEVGVAKMNVTFAPRYGFDYYGTGVYPKISNRDLTCRSKTFSAGDVVLYINFKFNRLRRQQVYDKGSLVQLITKFGGFWMGLILLLGTLAKMYNRMMFSWMMRDNDIRDMDNEAFTASGRLKKDAAYDLPKELEDTDI